MTGLPDGPPVAPRGACDPLAGVHAAFAVLAALHYAYDTGLGQLVELPMIETVLNATAIQPMEFEVFGVTLSRQGNRGHGQALQNLYRCAGDDDWIAVTVATDNQWRALVELMGRPSWCDDPALATVAGGARAPTTSIAGYRTGSPARIWVSRWNAWPRGHSCRARRVAIVGDGERAITRPRILRIARAPAHRARVVSASAVRAAGRPDPVVAAPAAHPRGAQ
ncbi:coA-transferase III family protein [Mycobacterium xenopi 4042]|uniref:CoA-transferase III family protein n=1 Tax=Mycobacterium xenopi 4042 TaxID=1299334 RepID=X8E4P7_MYCXE|nr:coA-transferase III family protein [Mycobacterium xenopi 4042]